ncbi:MAG: Polysaccharide biosynthesis protein [Parcubacteria group bacterium GW2011_GWC2_38_7]|nr:MAG: Polysaccharide biosynthesis protein [Parcubacteria group bacterium GW2011_GWC2_38_7]
MFKQSFFLVWSDIISKIVLFAFQIYMARKLGPESFGIYALAMTFGTMFIVFANYGLDVLAAKEIATDREQSAKYLGNLSLAKIPIALFTLLTMVLTALALGYSKEIVLYMFLTGISTIFLSYNRFIFGFFRAFGVLKYEAYITAGERIITSIACISIVSFGFGLLGIFSVTSLFGIASFIISFFLLKHYFISYPDYSWDSSFIKRTLMDATPLLILGIFSVIYFQIDIIMLSLMRGEEVVGLYSAAIRLFSLFQFIPGAVIGVLLPVMSRQFYFKDKQLLESLSVGIQYMLILGLVSSISIFLFANQIIILLYSDKFLSAVTALKVLIWSLPFFLINPILGNFLIATNNARLPVVCVGITAIINIVLNLFLIPKYSLIGSSIATLASETFLFLFQGYFSLKVLSSIGLINKPGLISISQSHLKKEVL